MLSTSRLTARILQVASLAALTLPLPAHGQVKGGPARPDDISQGSRLHPIPIQLDSMRRLHVTTRGRVISDDIMPLGGGLRGPCSPTIASHTDANFAGGSFVVQAGMVAGESAAATYTLTAAAFPLKIDLMEFIIATSGATQQVEFHYTIMVWDGLPNTGTLVFSQTATNQPADLPYAYVGPGTAGVNIQVSIDPADPDQIFVNNVSGTNKFSIAIRFDSNGGNNGSCAASAPTCCNAFPTTDTSGLQQSANNWLNGLNCGPIGCPNNGGWATFAALASFCRPSGDWVMRATWESVNCNPVVGSCCTGQTCSITTQTACTAGGGSYRGDNTTCGTACPIPTGSCCTNQTCTIVTQAACTSGGGTYRGDNTTCATACPIPTGACCFSNNNCLVLSNTDCTTASGTYLGNGLACGANNQCPTGACCLPSGGCITTTSPGCASLSGTFQGVGTPCGSANCPQPTGACCTASGGCIGAQTQANCALIPGTTWAGGGTTCPAACCRPDWDHNGLLQPADVASFVNTWFTSLQQGTLAGDYDGSGSVTPVDVSSFINDWFTRLAAGGC